MKRYRYRPALYLALLLGSATAFAQTPAAPGAAKAPAAPGAAKASAAPGAAPATNTNTIADRFAAADVNHDGKLTLEEATGKMPMVARNFDKIDKTKKGYVTLAELQAFAQERSAQRNAAKPPATN